MSKLFSIGTVTTSPAATTAGVSNENKQKVLDMIPDAIDRWSEIAQFPTTHIVPIRIDFDYDTNSNWVAGASRSTTSLNGVEFPATGYMTFNMKYIQSPGVILHEMGHILGIGFYFTPTTNPTRIDNISGSYVYHGGNAYREYKSYLAQAGYDTTISYAGIPVEDNGGPGTVHVHFEEDGFFQDNRIINGIYHPGLWNEVLTGYVDSPMPISRISIGLLDDMGYTNIDYSKADPYKIPRESVSIKYRGQTLTIQERSLTYGSETVFGRWLSYYDFASETFSNNTYMGLRLLKDGTIHIYTQTETLTSAQKAQNPTLMWLRHFNDFITLNASKYFNNPIHRGSWTGFLLNGIKPFIKKKMRLFFHHSDQKFYKPGSLASCGVGTASNSRLKSRKT
jgi:hypothetical protein